MVILAGCSGVGPYARQYETLNRQDGVTASEARVVAQYHFSLSDQVRIFKPGNPQVLDDRLVQKYSDFWFVTFYPRDIDQHFWRYLVVIEKKSGEVVWEGTYRPLTVFHYDWVFPPLK